MDKQVIEKIRKLIALSEDAKNLGSLEEAATAASKVQDMLMKYNLSMAEISKEKPSVVNEVSINVLKKGWNHRHGKWLFHLYGAIARANLCDIYVRANKGMERVFIIGEESNREITEYLADQLIVRIYRMENYAWRVYKGPEKRGTFRRGYLLGVTAAISTKLRESFERGVNSSESAQALVHVKNQAVKDFLASKNLREGKSTKVTGKDGFNRGHRDGKDMSINKGLKKNTLNQNLIG